LGQYLQLGICSRIVIQKERTAKLNVSIEKVTEALDKVMDMSLFERGDTEEQYIFTIKEFIVLDQLNQFLEFQFSLYPQQHYKESFETALKAVSEQSSLQNILELAKARKFSCFQRNIITDEILVNDWHGLKVEYDMWIMFVEGKLVMETYNNFLRYFEKQVRTSSKNWSISGAFRCFID